jgi:hypothetical protein
MKETALQRNRRQAFERKLFCEVLRAGGNTVYEEYQFDVREADKHARPKIPRAWRFDIAIMRELHPIAIEIEGYGHGHQGIKYMREDLEKYLEAFAQGWIVVRVSWAMIADGRAVDALWRYGVKLTAPRAG